MCFSGGSPPSVPDESSQANASNTIGNTASTAAGNLANYTQAGSTAQNAQTGMAQSALNAAGTSNLATGQAGQNFYTNTAIPAAQQNIAQSQAWGSPAGVSQAENNAAATTAQSYNAARLNNQQQLGSYGVDPSQMKSGALNLNANLQQAGAVGNAAYTAGQNRQLQGINLTNQAVGTALNTANTGAQYGATGSSDLNSSTQLGNQTLATTTQAQLAPSQYMSTALQGYGQSANINTQGYQNALAGAQYSNTVNTGEAAGIGQGVGAVGGLVADYFTAADGGGVPGRFSRMRRRFDNGGSVDDSSNIPSPTATMSDIAGPSGTISMNNNEAATDTGGSVQHVGLTPQQEQSMAQTAFIGGAGKGFLETYKANGGAIRGRRMQRFDDGGNVSVPTISIQPPERVGITSGGANLGQQMQKSQQSANSGMMSGIGGMGSMLGGLGGGGGSIGDAGSIGAGTAMSDFGDGAAGSIGEDAGTMLAADGGSMQRKRMQYGNPAVQRSQGVPPQVGIPGPWFAANGGPSPSAGSPPGTFISQGASDGTGIDDQVPARVSVGEYVIPADVVHHKGKEFFDNLVKRYHTPAQQQRQQMGMR